MQVTLIRPSFIATGIGAAALGASGAAATLTAHHPGRDLRRIDIARRISGCAVRARRSFADPIRAWTWWVSRLAPGFCRPCHAAPRSRMSLKMKPRTAPLRAFKHGGNQWLRLAACTATAPDRTGGRHPDHRPGPGRQALQTVMVSRQPSGPQ